MIRPVEVEAGFAKVADRVILPGRSSDSTALGALRFCVFEVDSSDSESEFALRAFEGRPSGPTALGALRGWEGPGLAGQACLHNCVTGLEQFGQGTRGRVSRLILILDKGTSSRSNWCAFL